MSRSLHVCVNGVLGASALCLVQLSLNGSNIQITKEYRRKANTLKVDDADKRWRTRMKGTIECRIISISTVETKADLTLELPKVFSLHFVSLLHIPVFFLIVTSQSLRKCFPLYYMKPIHFRANFLTVPQQVVQNGVDDVFVLWRRSGVERGSDSRSPALAVFLSLVIS